MRSNQATRFCNASLNNAGNDAGPLKHGMQSSDRRPPEGGVRANPRRRGFSLIELLIVIAIILIIAAIAVPKMNNQMMAAHEMAAIRQITTIHQAETQYYSQFGKYAESLAALGPPASGAATPAAADLIPKVLADGKNSGYMFAVQPSPTGYSITAVPEAFG